MPVHDLEFRTGKKINKHNHERSKKPESNFVAWNQSEDLMELLFIRVFGIGAAISIQRL
jgi:hypothetical protein